MANVNSTYFLIFFMSNIGKLSLQFQLREAILLLHKSILYCSDTILLPYIFSYNNDVRSEIGRSLYLQEFSRKLFISNTKFLGSIR